MKKFIPVNNFNMESGQAIMAIVVFLLIFGVIGVASFSFLSLNQTRFSREIMDSERSYFLTESGMEDVVYRIMNKKQYSYTELYSLDGGTATTTVTNVGSNKEVETEGKMVDYVRRVITVLERQFDSNFHYGVQSGRGGFQLENSAKLIGSVYSMGDIIGLQPNVEVTGDVLAASTSKIINLPIIGGNARANNISASGIAKSATSTNSISGTSVGINAYADKIGNGSVTRDAYYTTLMGSTTVGGSSFPGSPRPTDLPEIPFPITDAQISEMETAAQLGGVYTDPPSSCPYKLNNGTTTLGPLKINCDFELTNDAVVVLNGPIWVVGNFKTKNTSKVVLPASYGSYSEAIIADNPSNRLTSSKISTENTSNFIGSGASSSYIFLISQNNSVELGGSESAITPKDSTDAAVYYALHGGIEIFNFSKLKEATAYMVTIRNNATLTYESGLENIYFSSGPTATGYSIYEWKEKQ